MSHLPELYMATIAKYLQWTNETSLPMEISDSDDDSDG